MSALLPKSAAVNPDKHGIRLRGRQVVCEHVDVHRVQVAVKLAVLGLEREVNLREARTFLRAIESFVPRFRWLGVL